MRDFLRDAFLLVVLMIGFFILTYFLIAGWDRLGPDAADGARRSRRDSFECGDDLVRSA